MKDIAIGDRTSSKKCQVVIRYSQYLWKAMVIVGQNIFAFLVGAQKCITLPAGAQNNTWTDTD